MKRLRNRQLTRNRVLCSIVGAVLLAVGVLGLLVASDTVTRITDWADAQEPILNADLDQSIADNQLAFQLAALALAVICIVGGLLWLRSQIPPLRRQQDNVFANHTADVEGQNVVAGRALASAMEEDLEQHPGVERARVELRPEDELIRISVSAADALPISELARTVIHPATERAIRVGELPGALEVLTDVRLVPESRQLV